MTELTKAGQQLADTLVETGIPEGMVPRTALNAAAEILMPAEGAGLREAIVKADLQIGDGHIEAARRTLHAVMDTALVSPQPAVEGPVAAGVPSSKVDTQVWQAARELDGAQCAQPEWLWFANEGTEGLPVARYSFGRWSKVLGAAPYVRADLALTPPADPKPTVPGNDAGLREALADCTKEEMAAFEAWATERRYEMHEHPLHYIFMDPKTNAARMGWKAGLEFARGVALASQTGSAGEDPKTPDAGVGVRDALKEITEAADDLLNTLPGHWHDDATIRLTDAANDARTTLKTAEQEDLYEPPAPVGEDETGVREAFNDAALARDEYGFSGTPADCIRFLVSEIGRLQITPI